jgi:hypothetical protein
MMPARIAIQPESSTSTTVPPETQIHAFLAKYTPEIVVFANRAREKMRGEIPGGVEFVYDNYNALVFGYGPSERPSEAVLSLAILPEWVTLCFLKGATLSDPKKLLRGGGNLVRNVRLKSPAELDMPDIKRLIDDAIASATPPFPGGASRPRTVIRSISAKQRPRRPSAKKRSK